MQYILVFLLALAGYTLVDWGYQRVQHQPVSMWYLLSGNNGGVPYQQRQVMPGYQGAPTA